MLSAIIFSTKLNYANYVLHTDIILIIIPPISYKLRGLEPA